VQHQLPGGGNEFTLAPEGFHESFCADVPADDAAFYAVSQRPLAGVALTEAAPTPAWRSRPVSAVFGTADRCIDPGVHRFSYERMGATVTEIDGGSSRRHDLPPQRGSRGSHDRSSGRRRATGLTREPATSAALPQRAGVPCSQRHDQGPDVRFHGEGLPRCLRTSGRTYGVGDRSPDRCVRCCPCLRDTEPCDVRGGSDDRPARTAAERLAVRRTEALPGSRATWPRSTTLSGTTAQRSRS
jgi:hypothetical protein